jgi:hypothetical protein
LEIALLVKQRQFPFLMQFALSMHCPAVKLPIRRSKKQNASDYAGIFNPCFKSAAAD